ncbi:hypothetical protein BDZ88DRAFT_507862 [Geranomyces variabilis]|nr:hypothetical protein BDZ88DRAFT_507862 [Geranomyces variabilis]
MVDATGYDYRKQMFIVVYIHLLVWAIAWTFAYAIRIRKVTPTTTELPTNTTTATGTAHTGAPAHSRFIGAENAERVARMAFILAGFSTFMVSDLPYSNSKATAALMWVLTAITVLHVAAVLFTRHPYYPLGFGLLTFAIPIVIFALAFRKLETGQSPYSSMFDASVLAL